MVKETKFEEKNREKAKQKMKQKAREINKKTEGDKLEKQKFIENSKYNKKQITTLFGSNHRLCRQAGIKAKRKEYTDEEILEKVEKLIEEKDNPIIVDFREIASEQRLKRLGVNVEEISKKNKSQILEKCCDWIVENVEHGFHKKQDILEEMTDEIPRAGISNLADFKMISEKINEDYDGYEMRSRVEKVFFDKGLYNDENNYVLKMRERWSDYKEDLRVDLDGQDEELFSLFLDLISKGVTSKGAFGAVAYEYSSLTQKQVAKDVGLTAVTVRNNMSKLE